ncbi:DUF1488 family protein [Beijerinckia sp. L45]|uniref:DUF1488 family protein n=1 Tax=Beijerinckia sp. L45 TaxID=1641855 RepID=UPI00131DFEEE|nr:DUF1488 family protein [Beijerinckia sp. L45]
MPLESSQSEPFYGTTRAPVGMKMFDGKTTVSVFLSEQALRVLETHDFEGSLDILKRHRNRIEAMASRKYEECGLEDGHLMLLPADLRN